MKCANCNEPTTLACSGCQGSPVLEGDADIAYYCNATCQRANWKDHKPVCQLLKDRTKLYRVLAIAQRLWYIYRELTWAQLDIHSVEKSGEEFILRGTIDRDARWPVDYKVFPSHLLPLKEDKEAVLSYNGCVDGALWIVEVVEGWLKDIVSETQQVRHWTTNDLRTMSFQPASAIHILDTLSVVHDIIKITLRSGETFAIDLAGAQYGYHDPIMEWERYKKLRILEDLSSTVPPPVAYGVAQLLQPNLQNKYLLASMRKYSVGVGYGDTLGIMNYHILEWLLDEHLTFENLLKLPEERYEKKRDDLIDFVEWTFHGVVKKPYFTVNGTEACHVKWESGTKVLIMHGSAECRVVRFGEEIVILTTGDSGIENF
ncbi:hypothetical protein G7Y89_g14315 [Cudoniella acicularis]|uniref:MYND-type domain-containing protein n=1 Tax=Cudoniella acicularis TaxID=354080 RepID=A0A8H4R5D5_9HELO|nr:hypothetical protein G7Y89_g14315 [Cudoniella acicularis]